MSLSTTRPAPLPWLNPFWWVPSPSSTQPAVTPPKSAKVNLGRLTNSDRGLTASVSGNTLTLRGTARGVETKSPFNPNETDEYLRTQEFGGEIGFSFDLDTMPAFDTTHGYTEKNRWYFAHTVSLSTSAGMSAADVARGLARRMENADYRTVVSVAADGTASLRFERK